MNNKKSVTLTGDAAEILQRLVEATPYSAPEVIWIILHRYGKDFVESIHQYLNLSGTSSQEEIVIPPSLPSSLKNSKNNESGKMFSDQDF